eukprot:CAMPEP_0178898746 /NCGR_PEP_ID=MMETSP0786-20121207/2514_1 /TAXON_ID=186022 /ORGANISM="Thalassionema frauenfeldii, Strain CCMP 1798" /LENGTH=500 /DNA_ID=CAMNT_0020569523 /DNA_START=11 /DNA_END=1513 /DNA_ORIENTATION=-
MATNKAGILKCDEAEPKYLRGRRSCIPLDDDWDAGIRWMCQGRVDTYGFAKHFPKTSEMLMDNTLQPQAVIRELQGVYRMPTFPWQDKQISTHPATFLAHLTTLQALPPQQCFSNPGRYQHFAQGFQKDLNDIFLRKISQAEQRNDDEYMTLRVQFSHILQECLNEVCPMWSKRLDKELFQNKRRKFLKQCPIYQTSPSLLDTPGKPIYLFFEHLPDPNWLEQQMNHARNRIGCLANAVLNVSKGMHRPVDQLCWECMSVCPNCMLCNQCKVAQYCGRDCQVKAWKGGHKHKCKELKQQHKCYLASLKTVDEKYADGMTPIIEGITLSEEIDYSVLTNMFCSNGPRLESVGSYSMKAYYENLERVFKGEFWFCDSEHILVEQDYNTRFGTKQAAEKQLYFFILGLLTHDFFANLESDDFLDWDNAQDPAAAKQILIQQRWFTGFIQEMTEAFGCPMTVQRFKDLCVSNPSKQTCEEVDRHRLRREARYKIIHELMDQYHK